MPVRLLSGFLFIQALQALCPHPEGHVTPTETRHRAILLGKCLAVQLGPFPSPEETIPCHGVSFPRLWRMSKAVTQVPDVGGGGGACRG